MLKMGEKSTGNVTCPDCKHVQPMEIPSNSCQAFYKCEGCKNTISSKKTCCVFCDYGDKLCPIAERLNTQTNI
jgi:hypothetical protein